MRVVTERCSRCGSPVFEEDIDSGAAIDELTRCLCPRCASYHRKPAPVRRHVPAGAVLSPASPSGSRLVALVFIALVLSLILVYLHSSRRGPGARQTGRLHTEERPRPASARLSQEQAGRLHRAVAQYRLRRALSDESVYRRTRDRALELMMQGSYRRSAEVIEQYPQELRSAQTWEGRLAPLWREAMRLDQAAGEYSRALLEAIEQSRNENYAGAVSVLEGYAARFPDTPWAGESSRRVARLRKLQAAKNEPEGAPAKEVPEPAPPAPAPAEPERAPEPKKLGPDEEFRKKIKTAISRGLNYIEKLCEHAGSHRSSYNRTYPAGPTALALLARLKCGTDRDSDIVKNGFAYLRKQPLKKTYSVSLYMLALEAKFEPHGDELKPKMPFDEQLRKRFARYATAAEKQMVRSIVAWLRDAQLANGMWSYTGRSTSTRSSRRRRVGGGDGSNTQFAVLALYCAQRLGVAIPKDTVALLAGAYLEGQEKSGRKVKPFPVPAADVPIRQLREAEKKALKRRDGPHTVSVDELYGRGARLHKMRARGWGYGSTLRSRAYLSMTCAGVCNMVLAKAVLERQSSYGRIRAKADQAIRDGAAFISRNLKSYLDSSWRSGRLGWGLYYSLYSVERAGMLTLCEKFGEHLWYREGSELLFKLQGPDGSWGNCLEDTCFALLFLSRSTTPFIRTTGPIYTGPDLFPRKKK